LCAARLLGFASVAVAKAGSSFHGSKSRNALFIAARHLISNYQIYLLTWPNMMKKAHQNQSYFHVRKTLQLRPSNAGFTLATM
jgi:hypothetical protein